MYVHMYILLHLNNPHLLVIRQIYKHLVWKQGFIDTDFSCKNKVDVKAFVRNIYLYFNMTNTVIVLLGYDSWEQVQLEQTGSEDSTDRCAYGQGCTDQGGRKTAEREDGVP